MDVLITPEALGDLLRSDDPPVVLDVRWRLGGPPGEVEYAVGHVPGAVYVSLDDELAGHGDPTDGRHPLPEPAAFEAAARRWGVRPGRLVVAYDDTGNQAAARAWWLLRWAGHEQVRLLDGGLGAWRAAGGELSTEPATPAPGDLRVRPGAVPVVGPDELQPYAGVLLDARAGERYRGEAEPVDPVAGHIPGAVSLPTVGNLDAEGRFLPAEVLRERFEAAGVTSGSPVAAYCGSGVTAAHELAALAIAGFDGALYPGSWSQWSNLGLPVEVGDGTTDERPGPA